MQFTRIIVLYFVLGALMFGGGAVSWDDTGPTQYFVSQDQTGVSADTQPQQQLGGVGGAISSLLGQFGAPLVLVWNLVVGLVSFLNWPIFVMAENSVPPRVTVLFGGTLTVMFYGSLVRLVKSSA
ncbi:hypothetical protein EI982_14650 [Haloplanus rallus]|uniref:Uncharacterized protein n=1 Tax=Haloplanus rallus TaxID=1816183 RepID=A0A6B9F5Y1_9EURY|nr:hypothetical protein [Haloplanus rallus]QGX95935.1 hypothetical protein EI982_14650 [Haloplanus rallus]